MAQRWKMHDLTEPQLRQAFNAMAALLNDLMPAGPARDGAAMFVLLVFDDPGLTQFVSNCDRHNMIRALREAADRLEQDEVIER